MGAVMVFAVFAWCGCSVSVQMKKRCDLLEQFITALELLKAEIAFNGSDLKKAFENTAKMSGAEIFSDAARYLDASGINRAWEMALNEAKINAADKQVLMLLSSKLGKTDSPGQIKHIDYVEKMVMESRKNAVSTYENTGGLFRRGGVLLGILTVLILM